jgi:hypothetical protein
MHTTRPKILQSQSGYRYLTGQLMFRCYQEA